MTNKTSNPQIGERIKAIRKRLGENQSQFGEHFSPVVNKASVSRWESGKTLPSAAKLKIIANLGNVSAGYLINGSSTSGKEVNELLNKKIHGLNLTEKEKEKINEASFDIFSSVNKAINAMEKTAVSRIKKEETIIKNKPLVLNEQQTYSYFLSLLNLIRLYGTENQVTSFDALVNMFWQIAEGYIKYDKKDILGGVDELLSSFPINKDDEN